jgi:hypothetical protein
LRRQRNRTPNLRTCALGGFHDFLSRLVYQPVIEGLETNSDALVLHATNISCLLLKNDRREHVFRSEKRARILWVTPWGVKPIFRAL